MRAGTSRSRVTGREPRARCKRASRKTGAAEEIRTLDVQLGKLAERPWQGDPTRIAGYAGSHVSSYVPQSSDTSEAVDRAVFDGIRGMTPLRRLQIAARASRALHRLSVAGLRQRYPDATEGELSRRAGALRLGRELTLKAFGPMAEAWLE